MGVFNKILLLFIRPRCVEWGAPLLLAKLHTQAGEAGGDTLKLRLRGSGGWGCNVGLEALHSNSALLVKIQPRNKAEVLP